jgi:hypothetical protein
MSGCFRIKPCGRGQERFGQRLASGGQVHSLQQLDDVLTSETSEVKIASREGANITPLADTRWPVLHNNRSIFVF